MTHTSQFLLLLVLLFMLSACEKNAYPEDHEQLSEEERIVIRFSHVVGEDTPKGLAARKFAELVKERTNGYVEIQVFPNSFLYKDGEEISALLNGDVQMIAPSTSKVTSLVPEWQVFDLPFAFESFEEVQEYVKGPAGEVLFKKLEQEGMFPLAFWDNGFKQMTNNHSPLHMPADFSGLNFRIMASDLLSEQFELLDADSQVETFDQVFPVLDKEQLNAQENTFSNIVNKNIHSVQDYMTISNHGYLGYLVLINNEFWKNLPDDIQIIMLDTLREVTEWNMKFASEINEENYEELQACRCLEIHELTDTEKKQWEDAFIPLYERFEERYGASYIEYLPKYQ
ncbi:DctP family TRAP transporter solute-binding subunit [Oceanobacillus sp. APA_J-5(13-2)]|nr:DctP family TRAP transporter solute-binding subunit [Oceanobacillus alkalisoli]MCG5102175.1 DctP family TRAP transporter solute-binding subunit [Oceanobacillus alkalisoli]